MFTPCHYQIERLMQNNEIDKVPSLDLFYKIHKQRLKNKLTNEQLEKFIACLR